MSVRPYPKRWGLLPEFANTARQHRLLEELKRNAIYVMHWPSGVYVRLDHWDQAMAVVKQVWENRPDDSSL